MVELVKNMQACVTSFTSLTNTQRTGPRLTVTSALSGLIFFFFFDGVFFLLCLLLLSTFGNTEEPNPNVARVFTQEQHPRVTIIPQSSGDLKCLNLPISPPVPPLTPYCHVSVEVR